MIVKKATKQGPCKGVISAILKTNNAINDPSIPRPIYMLGKIVHNKNIIKAYENKGIIILDGDTRINLLDRINHGSVIITAHGAGANVYHKAKEKGLYIIDATCNDVLKTKNLIIDKLNENYQILYYGISNHPETEGVLSISDKITLITNENDINKNIDGKLLLTNQTTLSYTNVVDLYKKLKEKYPQIELSNEICKATSSRQQSIINEANGFDLCIVVGDKGSNNTNMLKKICEENTSTKAILVENVEDLNDINFDKINSIIVTSGASTPKCIVDEIITNLQNYKKPYKSHIKLDDYIKINN